MGLRNQPEFEQMEDLDIDTGAADTAANEAKTAIAKASGGAVSTEVKKFTVAFKDKNNVFDTSTVEDLSLAAPRIKGEQGSLFLGESDLGDAIQFELVSFNHRWAIGTGENDKEAKDYFKVSYDNETISGTGMLVSDYVDSLKAQGFAKAKKSPYMDLWGFVTWSAKLGHIAPEERQLACLQCSQTSMGAFTAFSTTRGLMESKGMVKPIDVIEVHAEKRTSGANRYTNFSFCAPKAK